MAGHLVKRALLIAYHFPPVRGSSGVLRTLKYAQHLPRYDWAPTILTISARAYPECSATQHTLPPEVQVHRAFGLDSARHLAIGGRYPAWLARPDRWSSWWLGAVVSGLWLVRKLRPAVLWSTYPIATAHCIGHTLHRLTGVPWVADFRDSMTEEDYPRDASLRALFRRIERRTMTRAARAVFTAPGTLAMYRQRYPELAAQKFACIANGYDEEDFVAALRSTWSGVRRAGRIELLHSGVLYPIERDPQPFFAALAQLKRAGRISALSLRVTLRATGHDAQFRPLLEQHEIDDLVTLAPPLDYHDALAEMSGADGLLLFQAANCDHQIPAKLYEYLRTGRPILALTSHAGDTAAQVRSADAGIVCAIDDAGAIARAVEDLLHQLRQGSARGADLDRARQFARDAQTGELARLFDAVSASRGARP